MNDMNTENDKIELDQHLYGVAYFKIENNTITRIDPRTIRIMNTKQKLNLSGIGSKRPTLVEVSEIVHGLFKDKVYSLQSKGRTKKQGIHYAMLLNELSQAACASGGEGKGVSGDEDYHNPLDDADDPRTHGLNNGIGCA